MRSAASKILSWWRLGVGAPDTTADGKQPFLIIGDSNAGHTSASTTVGPTTPSGTTYKWNGSGLTELTTLDLNPAGASNGTMWKQFALNRNATTGKKIVFIQCASGGSEYYPNGDTNNWYSSGGVNYDAAVADANACLSYLGLTKLKGIFVILGINDARGAQSLANIQTAINSLFTRLTANFPNTPIYVASNGTDDVTQIINARKFTVNRYVKEAIAATTLAERSLNLYSYYPWGYYGGDNLHLSQTGYNVAGGQQDVSVRSTETNKEVRQVLNGFNTELSAAHKAAWKIFIEGCQTDGNWSLLDSFQVYCGSVERNILIDHVGLFAPIPSTHTYVVNDRITTVSPGSFFKTNFVPSVTANNALVDDFVCGVKMAENNVAAGTAGYAFGAIGGTGVRLFQNASSQLAYTCNDGTANAVTARTRLAPNSWHTIARSGIDKYYYENAVEVHTTSAVAVGAACTTNIYVGGLNNAGVAQNIISGGFQAFYYAKKTGFNMSAFHTRVDTLLTALAS